MQALRSRFDGILQPLLSSRVIADYAVDSQESRLSGGTAGVVGVVVTLALVGGLTLLVRRRASQPAASD